MEAIKTAENIRRNIYVDNFITGGVDTIAEGETLYKEAKKVFNSMPINNQQERR